MRSSVAAVVLILSPTAISAQDMTPAAESFRSLAAAIPEDPIVTGEWVRLLPTIARQCGMTVDHERVRAVRSQTPPLPMIKRYAHQLDDHIKTIWDALAGCDLDEACLTADSL